MAEQLQATKHPFFKTGALIIILVLLLVGLDKLPKPETQ
jgi:hypothetical protein